MMHPKVIQQTFERGEGIFRLLPNFVPYRFNQAGGRLHLHPDDLYPLGLQYGSVKERWFSSVLQPYGKNSSHPEIGLSFVAVSHATQEKFQFAEAVEELGGALIGSSLMDKYHTWPMHAKFFDYRLPLFHHLHLDDAAAGSLGWPGKPEAYYYPIQLNYYPGEFPLTYIGFDPSVSKEQVKARLKDWDNRDVRITELSRAYRIELGSGWYTPPGVLHAPGSCLTYEPQWNSLVGAVFENISSGETNDFQGLGRSLPEEKRNDLDAILGLLDWDKNVDPNYRKNYFRPALPCLCPDPGASEKWITYANPYFSAKETSVSAGQKTIIKDAAAYGCVVIQGHGKIGPYAAEAPQMLRYGQQSADEFFVSEAAAIKGVVIENHSLYEPLVILKHFGPNNSSAPAVVPEFE
jgi:hypothetical protein